MCFRSEIILILILFKIFVKAVDVENKYDTGVKVECQEYDSKNEVSTGINAVTLSSVNTLTAEILFYLRLLNQLSIIHSNILIFHHVFNFIIVLHVTVLA